MVLLKLNVHEIVVENWVLTVKSNHWNIYRICLAMVRYLSLWLDTLTLKTLYVLKPCKQTGYSFHILCYLDTEYITTEKSLRIFLG